MQWKRTVIAIVVCVVSATLQVRSQVIHSAEEGQLPITIGTGLSNFSDDWGDPNPRQYGITVWIDWRFRHMPPPMQGLGIEFEGRDINWHTPSYLGNHRMQTALFGPIYRWRRYGPLQPFAKYLMGIGSIAITNTHDPSYQHDTRTVFAPAGGLNVRFRNNFSVRGEYEYQWWHDIFGRHNLNPHGFTIGVAYDLGLRSSAY